MTILLGSIAATALVSLQGAVAKKPCVKRMAVDHNPLWPNKRVILRERPRAKKPCVKRMAVDHNPLWPNSVTPLPALL